MVEFVKNQKEKKCGKRTEEGEKKRENYVKGTILDHYKEKLVNN